VVFFYNLQIKNPEEVFTLSEHKLENCTPLG
jgi:hypothetical protein